MFLGISAAVCVVERNSFSLSARAASYFLWPYLSSLRAPLSLPLPILFKSSLFLPAQRPHISFGTSHAAASQWEKRTEREREGEEGEGENDAHIIFNSGLSECHLGMRVLRVLLLPWREFFLGRAQTTTLELDE